MLMAELGLWADDIHRCSHALRDRARDPVLRHSRRPHLHAERGRFGESGAHVVRVLDRLALSTGSDPVPPVKVRRGYRFEPDEFGLSGLTPVASEAVGPPRVAECPVNLEAVVEDVRSLAADDDAQRGNILVLEVRVVRVHVHEEIGCRAPPTASTRMPGVR